MEAQQLHDSNQLLPRSQYFNTDETFSILANHFVSQVIVVKFKTLIFYIKFIDSYRARTF